VATPPTRPALRERYERRRVEVVDAAARVFAERGFHATSMQDLTDATGLAAGGLYHYIGSKDQLLVAICDQLMAPLLQRARELVAERRPPEDELRGLVRAWVEHVERHRHHMLVFQQERHVLEHESQWRAVRASRKEFEQLLDGVLRRGEEAGAFAFADRRLALLALLGMVNHTPQWFRARGRLSAQEVADGFVDLLLGRRAA
jgi:TetR/AcrR family transcriptional regulator, cholesterol catabolism regulator